MSKAIKSTSEIFPGKVIFYVCGAYGHCFNYNVDDIKKYIVKSNIYQISYAPEYYVFDISPTDGAKYTDTLYMSIGDLAMDPNRLPHNLNRVFHNYSDAVDFIYELGSHRFSDLNDQEFYDNSTPFIGY